MNGVRGEERDSSEWKKVLKYYFSVFFEVARNWMDELRSMEENGEVVRVKDEPYEWKVKWKIFKSLSLHILFLNRSVILSFIAGNTQSHPVKHTTSCEKFAEETMQPCIGRKVEMKCLKIENYSLAEETDTQSEIMGRRRQQDTQ